MACTTKILVKRISVAKAANPCMQKDDVAVLPSPQSDFLCHTLCLFKFKNKGGKYHRLC
jgi:hypothetical protein